MAGATVHDNGGVEDLDETQTDQAPVDQAAAESALRRAIEIVADEPVTTFRSEATLAGTPAIVIDGVADARVIGWRATARFAELASPPGSGGTMYARSAQDSVWMQMREWQPPRRGCWLLMDDLVPLGIQGLVPNEPAYISILGYLHTTGFADASHASLDGTLDLEAAVGLLQAQLFEYIDVSQSRLSSGEVPVEIGLAGRRITHVTMTGTDMLSAIKDVGGTVTGQSVDALEISTYTVGYPLKQLPANISAPPPNLVMEAGDTGCH